MFSSDSDRLINQAMLLLAADRRTLFMGQGVAFGGISMFKHLDGIPQEQRLEFPVAEELQLGVSTGLALQGWLPVCIFPRIDFLMRAMDQLVNHLDKIHEMSTGRLNPKVIIRTRVGSSHPLNAGPQHTQDHVYALTQMLTYIKVARIVSSELIMPVYKWALEGSGPTLIVEVLE